MQKKELRTRKLPARRVWLRSSAQGSKTSLVALYHGRNCKVSSSLSTCQAYVTFVSAGATKLLGWPLKDRNGKDRFPNRFFDLKISEMKSILNVIDGVAMIDHDRDGRHVIGVVQGHIDRIVRTYDDKHKENKELQNYLVRLRAALSVAAGDIGTPSGLTPVGLPNIPTPNISTASIQSASIPTASTIPNGNIPSPSNPPPSNMPPNSLTAAGSLPTQATTMPTVTPPSALPSSTGTVPQTATTPAIASPNQSTPQRV
mmetsp:Transcript_28933/g.40317  ORF Transcript_28933/g.40317 Transcript_28933/m.40317 type:complete len:258 (-) Transcript_28933:290-1063(-)